MHGNSPTLDYGALATQIESFAAAVAALGVERHDRVAIFLPKQFETVIGMFGAVRAGCVFVPVNPLLKSEQVSHILKDCNVRILVTTPERLELLRPVLASCHDLRCVALVSEQAPPRIDKLSCVNWAERAAAAKIRRIA